VNSLDETLIRQVFFLSLCKTYTSNIYKMISDKIYFNFSQKSFKMLDFLKTKQKCYPRVSSIQYSVWSGQTVSSSTDRSSRIHPPPTLVNDIFKKMFQMFTTNGTVLLFYAKSPALLCWRRTRVIPDSSQRQNVLSGQVLSLTFSLSTSKWCRVTPVIMFFFAAVSTIWNVKRLFGTDRSDRTTFLF